MFGSCLEYQYCNPFGFIKMLYCFQYDRNVTFCLAQEARILATKRHLNKEEEGINANNIAYLINGRSLGERREER